MAETIYTYSISGDFTSGVDVGKLDAEVRASSIVTSFNGVSTRLDVCQVIFNDQPSGAEESTLAAIISAHDGNPLPIVAEHDEVVPKHAYSFFRWALMNNGEFTAAQIDAGLLPQVYDGGSQLPDPPPSGASEPAFGIVRSTGDQLELCYWDFLSGGWVSTLTPWRSPLLIPGHIVSQLGSVGSGTSRWGFAMGPEVRFKVEGQINEMSVKLGDSGRTHAWAIRKSTTPGAEPPALASYSNVVASGVHSHGTANGWESVSIGTPILASVNDWFVAQVFPGTGSGQTVSIPTLRSQGLLNEDFAELHAGTYVSVGGANPGSTTLPVTRITSTLYGIASLDVGPRV